MDRVEWKVLSVDDDSENSQGLQAILSSRMESNDFEFTCTADFDEGIDLIKHNRFDLIFLDVHDETGHDPDPSVNPNEEDQRGEKLLGILKLFRFVPVVFYTGFPNKVHHLESHVVKVVDKGAPPDEVRSAVISILNTGLPQLTRHIEEQSRAYIWDNLESALKGVEDDNVTSDIALLAARNLAKNLSQRSVKELLGSELDTIAPLEMYLYPPEQGSCNPGDIYRRKEDGMLWMVLTPACDFEQGNAENVLLARVVPLTEHALYGNWLDKERELSVIPDGQPMNGLERDAKKARGEVKSLVKNRKGSRFKFLPGTFFLLDCVIDFQQLLNLPRAEADNYEVVCSLDNPYREEVLQLFSSYYGRIGTPDYRFDAIWKKIDQAFSP